MVLGSSLSLLVFKTVGKQWKPKLLRWEYVGCLWYNISYGDLFWRSLVGNLFIIYVAVNTHSPKYFVGNFDWNKSALAVSSKYLCFLSTTPFCWGVYGQILWCIMSLVWKKYTASAEVNSKPLSDLMDFNLVWNWFSMRDTKAYMVWRALLFLGYVARINGK